MLTMTDKEFQKKTYNVPRELVYGQIAAFVSVAVLSFGAYFMRGCFERKPEPPQHQKAVPESPLEKNVHSYDAPPLK